MPVRVIEDMLRPTPFLIQRHSSQVNYLTYESNHSACLMRALCQILGRKHLPRRTERKSSGTPEGTEASESHVRGLEYQRSYLFPSALLHLNAFYSSTVYNHYCIFESWHHGIPCRTCPSRKLSLQGRYCSPSTAIKSSLFVRSSWLSPPKPSLSPSSSLSIPDVSLPRRLVQLGLPSASTTLSMATEYPLIMSLS